MSAVPDYVPGWPGSPPAPALHGLLEAAEAAVGQLADDADLDGMADRDAVAVMSTLTTLAGRLDGLRVQVARTVRDRQICGLRGARNLAGWLRADARLADDAWKIARLAAASSELPQIAALLAAGTISMSQAATACWQISQLPTVPVPPPVIEGDTAAGPQDGTAVTGPQHGDAQSSPQDHRDEAGPYDGDADSSGARTSPGQAGLPAGVDPSGGEAWAGLWRAGDVLAAADELFAAFLPSLDGGQLRELGAHLREAADAQHRAADDHGDYARRGLRISRSLHGNGEITGRLHPEAAAQVIAAFEQLGGKTGPEDARTKAQRWADVLTRLVGPGSGLTAQPSAPADSTGHTHPSATPGDRGEEDDDQPSAAGVYTGHDPSTDAGSDAHEPGRPRAGHRRGARDSWTGNGFRADGPVETDRRDGGGSRAAGPRGPGQRGEPVPAGYQRPRIIVTVPLSTLLGRPLAPGATLGPGTPLTAEAARRLACDAEIIRLVTAPSEPAVHDHESAVDGGLGWDATARLTERMAAAIADLPPPLATPSAVLDIGRKSPGWTPRQRDALHAQYGGQCAAPRCAGPIEVIHHIIHWLYGGKTRIINGFPCCLYHHWLIHEGGWRIKKQPDGTITTYPPPPGWRPGTIYRRGQPVTEHAGPADTS